MTLETLIGFNGSEFVRENSFHLEQGPLTSSRTRCIDDRSSREEALKHPYAIPGGTLGAVIDAMAAAYEAVGDKGRLDPKRLFALGTEVIEGIVTFHTDTHNDQFACAGCGYCGSALRKDAPNFFSEEAADFLKGEGVSACAEALKRENIEVPSYDTPHSAKAVILVRGHDLGIHSSGVSGEHVYVYYPEMRDLLLLRIGFAMLPAVKEFIPDLEESAWHERILKTADIRLGNVLTILGADKLPMFKVSENGEEIVVDPISS